MGELFSNHPTADACCTVNLVYRPMPDWNVDKESAERFHAKTSLCNHNILLYYGSIYDSLPHFRNNLNQHIFCCISSTVGEMYGDCLFWPLNFHIWTVTKLTPIYCHANFACPGCTSHLFNKRWKTMRSHSAKSVSLDLEAKIETIILPHAINPTHISNIAPVNSAADSQRSLSDVKPCGVRLSVNFFKSVSIRSFRYLAQKVVAVEFEFLPLIFNGSLIWKTNM